MELREIAGKIGIAKYPEAMDAVYAAMEQTDVPACDLAAIEALEQEFGLYGKYYELMKRPAKPSMQIPCAALGSRWRWPSPGRMRPA